MLVFVRGSVFVLLENCLVCVASASAVWSGFPTKQSCLCLSGVAVWIGQLLLTCSDFRFTVGDSLELSGIQFTPPKQTWHRQDSSVVSDVAVWISSDLCDVSDIALILQQNRLRWCGHVLRKDDDDWVKKCTEYEVEGSRPRGRPKRTWKEVVREDCQVRKLNKEDAVDRCKWRKVIKEVRWPRWVWASGTGLPGLSRTNGH